MDAQLIANGTPGLVLMQRAAQACWREIQQRWPEAEQLTVLVGAGNNAGDGYLIAALAVQAGLSVKVLSVTDVALLKGDAAQAHALACEAGVVVEAWYSAAVLQGVVVDALLGTGTQGTVRPVFAEAITAINQSGLPVLAVDLPSGVCADTGRCLGLAVRAQVTVSLIGLKCGLLTGDAVNQVGQLVYADLDADPGLLALTEPYAVRLTASHLPRLAPRLPATHKGQCGHVLVVGGDRGMGGAGLLSAHMAQRAGAGLVSLATRSEHIAPALMQSPGVMSLAVESANQLLAPAARASVLVVGPGLGQGAWGRSLISAVASFSQAVQVWDADALNLLASQRLSLSEQAVLTPHPGEAARLLGITTAQVQADRFAAIQALVQRYQVCVVLKGAGTLISAPNAPVYVCDRGHPVMAGAGLGDVLSGLISGLAAQGLSVFDSACLAVWLHACAGERLAGLGRGLAAQDLIEPIRELLEEVSPCQS